jgi:hypothetical protein
LSFADRVVLVSEDGPPEAEYALFDPTEIELRATSPGAIREIGYETTAREALERLANAGLTPTLAAEAASAMTDLVSVYARGDVVRRAAEVLGAAELFESRTFRARAYEGVWLDVSNLAADLSLPGAAVGLQLIGLVAALTELEDDVRIKLRTAPYTETRRPGERTFRRVDVSAALQMPERLRGLAPRTRPVGQERRTGPTRVELLDAIRARSTGVRQEARARLSSLERATTGSGERQAPTQGPLSDPLMWNIESRLSEGSYDDALQKIGDVEKQRGTSPSTAYLRSRASLMMGSEPPQVVAERVSMLVAKAPFAELELLAAQAWAAAGNMGRALPYARVLTMDPTADAVVRGHARTIVDAAAKGVRLLPVTAPPPSGPCASMSGSPGAVGASGPAPIMRSASAPPTPREGQQHVRQPSQQPMSRAETPLPMVIDPANSVRPRQTQPRPTLEKPQPISTKPPPPMTPAPARRRTPAFAARVTPAAQSQPAVRGTWPRAMMKGGSLPALELEVQLEATSEVVEELSTPYVTGLPQASADARMQFTEMSKLLGRHYREERGITLRTDADSIEIVQAFLHKSHTAGIRNTAAIIDVRRHGAFISEVLARRLGAQWTDVSPTDLGHWMMEVPGIAKVRPFGRVLRFLSQLGSERDLVSFYLELWGLAQGAAVRP